MCHPFAGYTGEVVLKALSKIRSECKYYTTAVHCSGRLLSWRAVRGVLEQFSHNHSLDCLQFVCVRELELCGTVCMESVYHWWVVLNSNLIILWVFKSLKPVNGSEQVASCDFWLLFFFYYYYFAVNLVWFGFVCLEQWEKCMSMVRCKLCFKYNWKLKNHCITCIMQLKRIFLNQSLIWQQGSSFFFQLKCFNKNMIFMCPPWIQKWARLCSWTSEGIRMLLCDSISQPLVEAAAPMS